MRCLSDCKSLGEAYANYYITEDGELFRLYHSGKRAGEIQQIYGSINPDGYVRVDLRKRRVVNGCKVTTGKCYFMHTLVAMVFMGYEGEIDHIDRDKQNNKVSNLRKTTRSENNKNKVTVVTSKEDFEEEYAKVIKLREEGLSYTEISKALDITYQRVRCKIKKYKECRV